METQRFRLDGHTLTEMTLEVPLDYNGELAGTALADEQIAIFAREYVRDGQEKAPRLVFFQGGPGSPAPRPAPIGGWLSWALDHYRVVLLDERGTGLSTALDSATVTDVGDAALQARYLACFRADSMVYDAERLRRTLQDEPWHALGQSFGGFVNTSYLSLAPEGLASVMITAGLPSMNRHADDVYRLTWEATEKRHREYFARYAGDEARAWDIAEHLQDTEEVLPTGERLTPARFRMLGIALGMSYGPDQLHLLLEDPFVRVGGKRRLRSRFLVGVGFALSYGASPMYGVLHETIYAQASSGATNWSAHRIRDEFAQFELPASETEARASGAPFRFSGEHVFPWQVREDPALAPMAEAADILAAREDFPELHRPDVTADNTVPVSAWIYWDDMFVPASISLETAEAIRGLTYSLTNDYHHDGLRTDGPKLLERMHDQNREAARRA